jgi:hypothetical protein
MTKEKKNDHAKGRKTLTKKIEQIYKEIPYKSEKRRKAKKSKIM